MPGRGILRPSDRGTVPPQRCNDRGARSTLEGWKRGIAEPLPGPSLRLDPQGMQVIWCACGATFLGAGTTALESDVQGRSGKT